MGNEIKKILTVLGITVFGFLLMLLIPGSTDRLHKVLADYNPSEYTNGKSDSYAMNMSLPGLTAHFHEMMNTTSTITFGDSGGVTKFQGSGWTITQKLANPIDVNGQHITEDDGQDFKLGHAQTMGLWVHLTESNQKLAFVLSGDSNGNSKNWALTLDGDGSNLQNTDVYSGYLNGSIRDTNNWISNKTGELANRDFSNNKNVDPNHAQTADYWHHITLQWTPPANGSTIGTMEYAVDDLNPNDLSYKSPTQGVQTVSIDTQKLGIGTTQLMSHPDGTGYFADTSDTSGVYWGLQSMSGSGCNIAVVQSSSSYYIGGNGDEPDAKWPVVDGQASGQLTDKSTSKTLDADGSSTVTNGDQLEYTYDVTHDAAKSDTDWNNIKASLDLPSGFTVSAAKIMYDDGSGTETIDTNGSTSSIEYALKKALNASTHSATITIDGTADVKFSANEDTVAVNQATATFKGDYKTATTVAPRFKVKKPQLKIAPITPDNSTLAETVDSSQNASVKFAVGTNVLNAVPDKDNIKIIGTLNGKSVTLNATPDSTQVLNSNPIYTVNLANANGDGENVATNSYVTDSNQMVLPLQVGKDSNQNNNILTIEAVDAGKFMYLDSDVLTYTIHVNGETTLSVNPTYNFGNLDLSGKSYTTPGGKGVDKWTVNVKDTHVINDNWTLTAEQNGDFYDGDKAMRGGLIYRNGNDYTDYLINGATTIASGSQTDNSGETVSNGWGNDNGILVQINAGDTEGTYNGKINWTLTDGPSATN